MTGFVAFLDILGFSNLINRSNFSEEFQKHSEIITAATNKFNPPLQYVTFSDSIIIHTKDDSEKQLQRLLLSVAEISYLLLCDLNVPICGCVSHGHFHRLESENGDIMIAGSPITEAYQFEQKQDWIGTMLAPSIFRHNPRLREYTVTRTDPGYREELIPRDIKNLPWSLIVTRNKKIPFHKDGSSEETLFDGWAIIPQKIGSGDFQGFPDNLTKYRSKLDELKSYAPNPQVQKKYQSSSYWINRVNNTFQIFFTTPLWTKHLESVKKEGDDADLPKTQAIDN